MSSKHAQLRVNQERLWLSLMAMAEVGATDKGGCNRQALTLEDQSGRDLFIAWCRAAGCEIRIDQIGNIFARRVGINADLAPVITGSHLDTQATGGKFDGVYGVLAGLEVIRTLNDNNVSTERSIEVVVWTNEEGARFSPAMLGSGVWAGVFDLQYAYQRMDHDGVKLEDALQNIDYRGETAAVHTPVHAAFEVHIEQGPILEAEGKTIGVLSGIQGMYWYDLILTGEPCHAGPTPMDMRKDPFMGAADIIQRCYETVETFGPWARVTFGDISVTPAARNTVPEQLVLAIDIRHPDGATLSRMEQSLKAIIDEAVGRHQLTAQLVDEWRLPPTEFAPRCIEAVRGAVEHLGYSAKEMVSGAGHDSGYLAKVAPTSMIFVPCERGISHNEAENAKSSDLGAGANVLLHSMLSVMLPESAEYTVGVVGEPVATTHAC